MHYSIRHVTRFRYSAPVRESVMELRMQPRSEGPQTLRSFQIATNPRAQLYAYTDHLGNAVYHFDVPQPHDKLTIIARSAAFRSPVRCARAVAARMPNATASPCRNCSYSVSASSAWPMV